MKLVSLGVQAHVLNFLPGNLITSNALTSQSLEPTDSVDANENKVFAITRFSHSFQQFLVLSLTC